MNKTTIIIVDCEKKPLRSSSDRYEYSQFHNTIKGEMSKQRYY